MLQVRVLYYTIIMQISTKTRAFAGENWKTSFKTQCLSVRRKAKANEDISADEHAPK